MFRRLAYKFQQFMLGRRGFDTLGFALIIAYFALSLVMSVLRFFAHLFAVRVIYIGLWAFSLVGLVFFFIRFFSRNFPKREKENRAFLKFYNGVKSRVRDRKTHAFFKCPACKNTLRVPKGRGKITVTCPVCREKIQRRS